MLQQQDNVGCALLSRKGKLQSVGRVNLQVRFDGHVGSAVLFVCLLVCLVGADGQFLGAATVKVTLTLILLAATDLVYSSYHSEPTALHGEDTVRNTVDSTTYSYSTSQLAKPVCRDNEKTALMTQVLPITLKQHLVHRKGGWSEICCWRMDETAKSLSQSVDYSMGAPLNLTGTVRYDTAYHKIRTVLT
jgi:hypothetical protein